MRQKFMDHTSGQYFYRENDHADEYRKLKHIFSAEGDSCTTIILLVQQRNLWHRLQEGSHGFYLHVWAPKSLEINFLQTAIGRGIVSLLFLLGWRKRHSPFDVGHSLLATVTTPPECAWHAGPDALQPSFQVLLEGMWFVNTEQISF